MTGAPPPSIMLASASPRRRQLLKLLGVRFRVRPSALEETPAAGESAAEFACRAAREKALEVAASCSATPVLAADTVVEIGGEILGKPGSAAAATEMLRRLSARTHRVHTGVAVAVARDCAGLVDSASVRFVALNEAMIRWYVDSGEPLDKAGAYGIQGSGGLFVAAVEGSPHTVVGLPLHKLPELFSRHRLDFWDYLRRRRRSGD